MSSKACSECMTDWIIKKGIFNVNILYQTFYNKSTMHTKICLIHEKVVFV